MRDTLSIPPDLDRALAMTVLDAVRASGTVAAAGGGLVVPPRLDEVLGQVVRELVGQGASRDDVLDALQDAFAALLAARQGDPGRGTVAALEAHARDTAARLLRVRTPV